MNIFLIDFENVKSKGLTGIDKLPETDKVIIFYSENSDTISFEMHQKVLTSKAAIEYFKVHVGGKNALDFQLSTLLGYLIAKDEYENVVVISNDRGFDFLHDFWHGPYIEAHKANVLRTRTIQAAINYNDNQQRLAMGLVVAEPVEDDLEEELETETENEAAAESEVVQTLEETTEEEAVAVDEPANEPVEATEVTEAVASPTETEEEEPIEACAPDLPTETLVEPIETAEPEKEQAPKRKPRKKRVVGYKANLQSILSEICNDEQIETIGKLIPESNTKEELHNSLAKVYKQQATDFYKLLRPKYLRLKGLYDDENGVKTEENKPEAVAADVSVADDIEPEKIIYHDVLTVKLSELMDKKCSDDELERIKQCVVEADTKQQLYIKMVKAFRKEKGCAFYNVIRSEYQTLHKMVQENEI